MSASSDEQNSSSSQDITGPALKKHKTCVSFAELVCRGFEVYALRNRLPSHSILIRVFAGGSMSNQPDPFDCAFKSFGYTNVSVEYKFVEDVKADEWFHPGKMVDWLLRSHIHFIIAHPHQGFVNHDVQDYCLWNISELKRELQRLKLPRGFPTGDDLDCPIFTQDKYVYHRAVPDLTLPTMRIPLVQQGKSIKDDNKAAQMIIE